MNALAKRGCSALGVGVAALAMIVTMRATSAHSGPPAIQVAPSATASASAACSELGPLQNVGYVVAPLGEPAAATRLGVAYGHTVYVQGGVPVAWVGLPVRRCAAAPPTARICIGTVCVAERPAA